jgi:hypothetical protein
VTAFPSAIAPHFPELAGRYAAIPESDRDNARAMLELLERARAAGGNVPITVSSWWRSKAGNTAAGGSSSSQHLTASAVDFEPDGDPALWFETARRALPANSYGQIIYYRATSRHLHLSLPNRSSGRTGEQLVEVSPKKFAPVGGGLTGIGAIGGPAGDDLEGVARLTWRGVIYSLLALVATILVSEAVK